jgi:hypothetical protein
LLVLVRQGLEQTLLRHRAATTCNGYQCQQPATAISVSNTRGAAWDRKMLI